MHATLAPLLALAPTVVAAPDGIEWRPGFEQALERAAEQGRVVLVAVGLEDEGQSERLIEEVYGDAEIVRLSRETVNLVAANGDHAREGKPCPRFAELRCADHRRTDVALRQGAIVAELGGAVVAPAHLFLSPDGDVLLSVPLGVDSGELEWCFVRALRALDPGFEWTLSSDARAPKQLFLGGLSQRAKTPATHAEARELIDGLKRSGARGSGARRALERLVTVDDEDAIDFVKSELRSGKRGRLGRGVDSRPGILRRIGAVAPRSYWPLAAEFAGSGEEPLRRQAAVALEQLSAPESLKAIRTALAKEKDPAIEGDLLRALGSAGASDERTRKTLIQRARSEKERNPPVRVSAVIALGHLIPTGDVDDVLRSVYEREQRELQIAAVCAMGMTRSATWKEWLEAAGRETTDRDVKRAIDASLAVLERGDLTPLRTPLEEVAGDEMPRERFFGRKPPRRR